MVQLKDSLSKEMMYFKNGIALILQTKNYLLSFILLSILLSSLYFILLPSLPLGSINLQVVRFITPTQAIFAIAFGILFSFIILMDIRLVRSTNSNVGNVKSMALSSVFASLVNGLCCTPLIPSLLALFSTSPIFLFTYSPAIQAFFERYYSLFYLFSIIILLISFRQIAKNLLGCCGVGVKHG